MLEGSSSQGVKLPMIQPPLVAKASQFWSGQGIPKPPPRKLRRTETETTAKMGATEIGALSVAGGVP